MSRHMWGRVIIIIGAVVLLVFALADLIGIGQSPDEIGYRQLLGVVAGALIMVVGFYITRRAEGEE